MVVDFDLRKQLICEGCGQLESVCLGYPSGVKCCPDCKHNLVPLLVVEERDKEILKKMQAIIDNDKTPKYEYDGNYDNARNSAGKVALRGERWKMPRELALEVRRLLEGGKE